ncbi:hypothetical protein IWQ49_001146 [Labrenzia sp. EL_126]|nr:hypothetical protein [Labrenzia sp. EL_126]
MTIFEKNRVIRPEKEIRAAYSENTIRVYQAYSDEIANSAIKNQTFVSPPFKLTRMTWIKPSFLWMMYRAGWSHKDKNQARILAIDISQDGFHWTLQNSCLSSHHFDNAQSAQDWQARLERSPVRIQWDPERDLFLNKLDYRSIQIGLSGEAVERYARDWIVNITDITLHAQQIKAIIDAGNIDEARALLPREDRFEVSGALASRIGLTKA